MSQSMVHSKMQENKMKERDQVFFNPKAPKKDQSTQNLREFNLQSQKLLNDSIQDFYNFTEFSNLDI